MDNGLAFEDGTESAMTGRRRAITIAALVVIALAGAACVPGRLPADDAPAATAVSVAPEATAATAPAPPLEFSSDAKKVHCDGLSHDVGQIRGALPGERILLSSALPIDLSDGLADDQGRFKLVWSCDQTEARLQWDILAVGHDSGRRVEFTIVGSAEDPALDGKLVIDVAADPFPCDAKRRPIGTITGAQPFESITFSSPQGSDIRGGQADDRGELELNWECTRAEAGTTWLVTAAGTESGKTGQFQIVGDRALPGPEQDIQATVEEDPFVCDGESRRFAVLANFAPVEVVDFTSDQASGLIDGRADADGSLPIRWQCGRDDVGKTWTLTATGVDSGRSITISFTGAEPPSGTFLELAVAMTEDPFACDGGSRVFATISNFQPREFVDFSSPQADQLRQGQADEAGLLPIRWQCGAGDIDSIWDLTATGATSNKSITIRITGGAPSQ